MQRLQKNEVVHQEKIWDYGERKYKQERKRTLPRMVKGSHGETAAQQIQIEANLSQRTLRNEERMDGLLKFYSSVRVWGFSRLHEKRLNKQTKKCRRCRFNPWVGKISWRKWQPTLVFLPEESHGQRSLVGYSPGVTKSWTQLCPRAHKHTYTTDNTNKNLI